MSSDTDTQSQSSDADYREASGAQTITNWRWRFTHLYHIKPADERPTCLFEPRAEQWKILEDLYENGNVRIAILKARQLGFSTLLALVCLDWLLFRPGVRIAIIDQTAADAEKKRRKIKHAWNELPEDFKSCFEVISDSEGKFVIKRLTREGREPDQERYLEAGMRARGDTFQFLWVSEWGPIQFEDVRRSDAIADGALPAADKGTVVIETTWRGGKAGRLYTEVVENALKLPEEYRTLRDWIIRFFPWQGDKTLTFEGDPKQIGPDCLEYFKELKEDGITLTSEQKLWYFKNAWGKEAARFEEYPSRLEEIFLTPVKGAIYAPHINKVRVDGRVCAFQHEPDHLVSTTWDIGSPANTVVVYWQHIGIQRRVIDCDLGEDLNLGQRVAHMLAKGYTFGAHYLPHDAQAKSPSGYSFLDELTEAGLKGCEAIPRTEDIHIRINRTRAALANTWFADNPAVEMLLSALSHYRYKEDKVGGGYITSHPVHDWASHPSDAFGYMAEVELHGLLLQPDHSPEKRLAPPRVVSVGGY